jgi:hypothetical protein
MLAVKAAKGAKGVKAAKVQLLPCCQNLLLFLNQGAKAARG